MVKLQFVIYLVIFGFGCTQQTQSKWTLVYQNDPLGNPISGNKQELLEAVKQGNPIRVAFGGRSRRDSTKTVDHFFQPDFLTILNDEDLYAQAHPIIGQIPDLLSDTTSIVFRENIKWTILVGTNGFSDRLSVDYLADSIFRHNSNVPTSFSWYVEKP